MPSTHRLWNLGLTGTNQTSHGLGSHNSLGVLNLFVRRQLVSRNLGSRTEQYGHPIEVARTLIGLPRVFPQLPVDSSVHIKHLLARFGVDPRSQSSFAMRILRAAQGLSAHNPRGYHLTAILEQTILEISEMDDLVVGEVMQQLESELGHVVRGASESAILGLQENIYDAEDSECCSICLEEYHRKEKITELPCSHVFHRTCIIQWLGSNNSCPLCRYRLDT